MVLTSVRDRSTLVVLKQVIGTRTIPSGTPVGIVGNATGPYALFGQDQVIPQTLGSTALGATTPAVAPAQFGSALNWAPNTVMSGNTTVLPDVEIANPEPRQPVGYNLFFRRVADLAFGPGNTISKNQRWTLGGSLIGGQSAQYPGPAFAGQAAQVGSLAPWAALAPAMEAANQFTFSG